MSCRAESLSLLTAAAAEIVAMDVLICFVYFVKSRCVLRSSSLRFAAVERGQLGGSYGGRVVDSRAGASESLPRPRGAGIDSTFCRVRETRCLPLEDILGVLWDACWELPARRCGGTRRGVVKDAIVCQRRLNFTTSLVLFSSIYLVFFRNTFFKSQLRSVII